MNQKEKIGQFLKTVIKLPPAIEFLTTSEGNILWSDPYTEEDIIYYVYLAHYPGDNKERLLEGIKVSLFDNPQFVYEKIKETALEFQEKINRNIQ